jgi:hypothetical protein
MRHSRPYEAPAKLVDPQEKRYGWILSLITLASLAVAVSMIGKAWGTG